MKGLIFLIFASLLFSCSDTSVSPETDQKQVSNYYTILTPLPDSFLNTLKIEFFKLNNHRTVSRLNKYGFTGNDGYYHSQRQDAVAEDQAIHLSREALVLNKKFTNVIDSLDLVLKGASSLDGGKNWILSFEDQVYHGFNVEYSEIRVKVNGGEVYSISGFWFPDVNIPAVDTVTQQMAKQNVLGEQITYFGSDGTPIDVLILEESIIDSTEKTIFPLTQGENIELRVTWKIGVTLTPMDNWAAWDIYVDTTTGEIVAIVQNFRT